jgi:hypothetical protein
LIICGKRSGGVIRLVRGVPAPANRLAVNGHDGALIAALNRKSIAQTIRQFLWFDALKNILNV